MSVVIAAILLIGPIAALYRAKDVPLRLAIMSVFTVVFAAFVGLVTNARRAEIFGSTVAYIRPFMPESLPNMLVGMQLSWWSSSERANEVLLLHSDLVAKGNNQEGLLLAGSV